MPVKASEVIKAVVVIGVLIWAGRTVPYWGTWVSGIIKMKPAEMCAASEIVDRITTEIRNVNTVLEKSYGGKPSLAAGSSPEPDVTVVVDRVTAVDFNSDIDRVKCVMNYQVEGAERASMMAALTGQGIQRTLTFFVQPDANGHLIVSW